MRCRASESLEKGERQLKTKSSEVPKLNKMKWYLVERSYKGVASRFMWFRHIKYKYEWEGTWCENPKWEMSATNARTTVTTKILCAYPLRWLLHWNLTATHFTDEDTELQGWEGIPAKLHTAWCVKPDFERGASVYRTCSSRCCHCCLPSALARQHQYVHCPWNRIQSVWCC